MIPVQAGKKIDSRMKKDESFLYLEEKLSPKLLKDNPVMSSGKEPCLKFENRIPMKIHNIDNQATPKNTKLAFDT
jgi:hypothetical protein